MLLNPSITQKELRAYAITSFESKDRFTNVFALNLLMHRSEILEVQTIKYPKTVRILSAIECYFHYRFWLWISVDDSTFVGPLHPILERWKKVDAKASTRWVLVPFHAIFEEEIIPIVINFFVMRQAVKITPRSGPFHFIILVSLTK